MIHKSTLPGFRFHPTDAELVLYYLKRKIQGTLSKSQAVISEVDICMFAPWELPEKSYLQSKDLEWYFLCPRNNKYARGKRINRANDIGFWKPTGEHRPVINKEQTVGKKTTLVFHTGKPPGTRTDWVMHEFMIEKSDELVNAGFKQDAYVLCKVFKKSGQGPKPGAQYGAPFNEEDWHDEVDTDISNDNSLPSALVINTGPLQSVALQAGELNSVHHVQNSSLIQPSSVGAETSLQVHFEVGESSRARELSSMQCNLPRSCSDGVSLGSLTQGNAHLESESQMPGSALSLDNSIQYADLDFDLGDLGDLDTIIHHLKEPDDGFSVLEVLSYLDNPELQPSTEYANGDYLTVDDMASENQVNAMEQPPPPNVQDSLNVTFGDDRYDHFVDSLLTKNPQHMEMSDVFFPCIAYPDCQCCNNL